MRILPCICALAFILSSGTAFGAGSEADQAQQQMKSKNKVDRRQGAEKLASLRDAAFIPDLTAAMGDSDGYVRMEAARGLAMLHSEKAAAPLIKTLEADKSPEVRETAALGLRTVQTPAVFDALVKALKDVAEPVRVAAVSSLAQFRDVKAVDALTVASADSAVNVRRRIAIALGEVGRDEARPTLDVLAKDPDATVQAAAQQALTRFKKETNDQPQKISH
jgi:HEAT repeat protein